MARPVTAQMAIDGIDLLRVRHPYLKPVSRALLDQWVSRGKVARCGKSGEGLTRYDFEQVIKAAAS